MTAAGFVYFMLRRWDYNALQNGADTASSLGVNTRTVTLVSMGMCTLASALAVSFVGIISFVGLVAPHIMRRFVDSRALRLLLLLADLFSPRGNSAR